MLTSFYSTYGATRAWRLARRPERWCGKPPRSSGRRLWRGLSHLSGVTWQDLILYSIFIFVLSGGWAAGYWYHCPSVPPSKPGEKYNTRDKSLLFRSLNKCYWIRDSWSLNTKQPNKWYHKLASILDIYYCWLNKKLKRGFFTRRQKSDEIPWDRVTRYLMDRVSARQARKEVTTVLTSSSAWFEMASMARLAWDEYWRWGREIERTWVKAGICPWEGRLGLYWRVSWSAR